MVKEGAYFWETETDEGELVLFEAGDHRGRYVAGQALDYCEMPVLEPRGDFACERVAVAKVKWTDGETWPVCQKHYDNIRNDFSSMGLDHPWDTEDESRP